MKSSRLEHKPWTYLAIKGFSGRNIKSLFYCMVVADQSTTTTIAVAVVVVLLVTVIIIDWDKIVRGPSCVHIKIWHLFDSVAFLTVNSGRMLLVFSLIYWWKLKFFVHHGLCTINSIVCRNAVININQFLCIDFFEAVVKRRRFVTETDCESGYSVFCFINSFMDICPFRGATVNTICSAVEI